MGKQSDMATAAEKCRQDMSAEAVPAYPHMTDSHLGAIECALADQIKHPRYGSANWLLNASVNALVNRLRESERQVRLLQESALAADERKPPKYKTDEELVLAIAEVAQEGGMPHSTLNGLYRGLGFDPLRAKILFCRRELERHDALATEDRITADVICKMKTGRTVRETLEDTLTTAEMRLAAEGAV